MILLYHLWMHAITSCVAPGLHFEKSWPKIVPALDLSMMKYSQLCTRWGYRMVFMFFLFFMHCWMTDMSQSRTCVSSIFEGIVLFMCVWTMCVWVVFDWQHFHYRLYLHLLKWKSKYQKVCFPERKIRNHFKTENDYNTCNLL